MSSPHLIEFVAARGAEALQQIDRAVDGHFAQFDEALVRLQIGVQDFSGEYPAVNGLKRVITFLAGLEQAARHLGVGLVLGQCQFAPEIFTQGLWRIA